MPSTATLYPYGVQFKMHAVAASRFPGEESRSLSAWPRAAPTPRPSLLISEPIVDAFNASDGVTHDALRNIGADASTRHQAARSPAQIMEHPIGDRHLAVECPFHLRPAGNVAIARV